MPEDRRWKLDHHIPSALLVSIFLGLLTQGVIAIRWAATVENRINVTEQANVRQDAVNNNQDAEIGALEAAQAARDVTSATASAELRALRDSIGEIKETLADQNLLLREILTNGKDK